MMDHESFSRLELLIGEGGLSKLARATVFICGVGGVGSWCAEALARSGVGHLVLMDDDAVKSSNINRQLCALHSTLGRSKVEVLAERLKDIAPDAVIEPLCCHLTVDACGDFIRQGHFSCVVDAIDEREPKLELLTQCVRQGIPVISSMGAGNKLDPAQVQVADISESHGCPLARSVRQSLRKNGIDKGIRVVFSPEPMPEGARLGAPEEGRRPVGSFCPITAIFGLTCAAEAIKLIDN